MDDYNPFDPNKSGYAHLNKETTKVIPGGLDYNLRLLKENNSDDVKLLTVRGYKGPELIKILDSLSSFHKLAKLVMYSNTFDRTSSNKLLAFLDLKRLQSISLGANFKTDDNPNFIRIVNKIKEIDICRDVYN